MRTFPLAALLPVCLRFVRATCAPPLAALRPNRRSIRFSPSLDRNPPQPPRTIRFRSLNTRATWRFAPESLPTFEHSSSPHPPPRRNIRWPSLSHPERPPQQHTPLSSECWICPSFEGAVRLRPERVRRAPPPPPPKAKAAERRRRARAREYACARRRTRARRERAGGGSEAVSALVVAVLRK